MHIFVKIPPHLSVSEFLNRGPKIAKDRSSHKIQQKFPQTHKEYWGRHFWGRGGFSATSGNVTDDIINHYIDLLLEKLLSMPTNFKDVLGIETKRDADYKG